ncbi:MULTISPECIES: enoyl-CoA hydratase/isomerase family protein [Alcaligenaceae]|uniref:Enoyl-CoA hydratase n=1 Tax=Bordetella petrii (strain ATCC BAA-461 / DSM 12804 / CCUG 43448 / CIP 107267 / Se-1111R) TaxID=340100 RepID=A9IDP1_BORPD|nr:MULTISPECIES: enoyl-CoA hydratase/isomerase family protein [Alcaligenaceae]CAP41581.1 putative enoyl-CoA hydratase [Bordetella petrii]CUJ31568.1 Probable enoyl-CoA hydratase echA8 [Achromobacter xylosoxidans]CUJ71619.1 Probable enoyl-CoA hydratase echA8 [Achromobacter xylosoxidans]
MTDRYGRYERLAFDHPAPRVLRITMRSPLKMGAMDALMHREVSEIWRDVDADDSVNVVIFTGDGKTFSAGGDLKHERKVCDDYTLRMRAMKESRDLVTNMLDCRKPIITAARGWAVGAGLATLLLADVSIVAKDAKFSDGHLKIGVAAGDHAAIIWPILCGMAKAKYYLLTAETLTGEEAERMNLVSVAVPDEEVEARALEVASRLAQGAAAAQRWTKMMLNHWIRQAQPIFDASLALEFTGFAGPEGTEGIDAFLEKRSPKFDPNCPF